MGEVLLLVAGVLYLVVGGRVVPGGGVHTRRARSCFRTRTGSDWACIPLSPAPGQGSECGHLGRERRGRAASALPCAPASGWGEEHVPWAHPLLGDSLRSTRLTYLRVGGLSPLPPAPPAAARCRCRSCRRRAPRPPRPPPPEAAAGVAAAARRSRLTQPPAAAGLSELAVRARRAGRRVGHGPGASDAVAVRGQISRGAGRRTSGTGSACGAGAGHALASHARSAVVRQIVRGSHSRVRSGTCRLRTSCRTPSWPQPRCQRCSRCTQSGRSWCRSTDQRRK